MTALTKDRNTMRKEGGLAAYGVAEGVIIFAGAMVALNAAGYAVPAADTSGCKFVGVSRVYVDNSGGGNGDQTVTVLRRGIFNFAAAGMAQTDVGVPVFVSDDQTVAKTTTNGIGCGIITEVDSDTKVWVDIGASNRRTGQAQDGIAAESSSSASLVTGAEGDNNAILWTARHPGTSGNDLTVALLDPGETAQSLEVSVNGNAISVSLATDGGGAITSTAADVIAAVAQDDGANALVIADNEGSSTGAGVVAAVGATELTGGTDISDEIKTVINGLIAKLKNARLLGS